MGRYIHISNRPYPFDDGNITLVVSLCFENTLGQPYTMVLVLCFLWRVSLGLLSILYLHLSDHYTHAASVDPAKPNIIFIITDDQDVRTGTLDYMPKLHTHIAEQGVTFTHFYAPVSLCCPSRVSLLRAQYAHNHNVTYVSGPFGGMFDDDES